MMRLKPGTVYATSELEEMMSLPVRMDIQVKAEIDAIDAMPGEGPHADVVDAIFESMSIGIAVINPRGLTRLEIYRNARGAEAPSVEEPPSPRRRVVHVF